MNKIIAASAVLSVLFLVFSHPICAAALSTSELAKNCKTRVDLYATEARKAERATTDTAALDLSIFDDKHYTLMIGGRVVPVFPFKRGVSNAILVAVVGNGGDSSSEQPAVTGICPDSTGHEFTYDGNKTLGFASNKEELLTLLFRIDRETLPHTAWHASGTDCVYMLDTSSPPPAVLPVPKKGNWCAGRKNDAKVSGYDLSFTVCPHHGTPRDFVYVLDVLVNGKSTPVDPQIINRPH